MDERNKPLRPPLRGLPKGDVFGKQTTSDVGRDPAIFAPIDAQIAAAAPKKSPVQRKGRKRASKPLSHARTQELELFVRFEAARIVTFAKLRFGAQLRHLPGSMKRLIIRMLSKELPPKPRAPGRPRKVAITRALKMHKAQLRQINGKINNLVCNYLAHSRPCAH